MTAAVETLMRAASTNTDTVMLGHTHGQAATPTTLGRELGVFLYRLADTLTAFARVPVRGKCSGAVGNFAAHYAACPEVDWEAVARSAVTKLGLDYAPLTTQIEPHDWMAQYANTLAHFNTVLLDASRDIWLYTSRGYFKQAVRPGEVGSSTMPHKVNPIYFENAEGNLGVANALLNHFAAKLPVSRMQRDLSDSTVLRCWGTALGHCAVAYAQFAEGMTRLDARKDKMKEEVDAHPEVLAEAVQTVMRAHRVPGAYEMLKEATRGKDAGREDIVGAIRQSSVPGDVQRRVMALTPETYMGISEKQAREAVQRCAFMLKTLRRP